MADNDFNNLTFEEAMQRLEDLVKKLESGETTLETSVEYYTEGIKLAGQCNRLLNEAENKIKILSNGEEKDFHEQ